MPKFLNLFVPTFLLVAICFVTRIALADDSPTFDTALMMLVDAIKIGQVGAIITAVIQILKTQFVQSLLTKFFFQKKIEELNQDESTLKKYLEVGKVLEKAPGIFQYLPINKQSAPLLSVGAGVLGGIGEALMTGKPLSQAVFEGVLSSGVSMALYDLIWKPASKLFKKDNT